MDYLQSETRDDWYNFGTLRKVENRMKVMNCWPMQWLKAAQRAGFAIHKEGGEWEFLNDGMRESLEQFAMDIAEQATLLEREACIKFFSDEAKKYHPGNGKEYRFFKFGERHLKLRSFNESEIT